MLGNGCCNNGILHFYLCRSTCYDVSHVCTCLYSQSYRARAFTPNTSHLPTPLLHYLHSVISFLRFPQRFSPLPTSSLIPSHIPCTFPRSLACLSSMCCSHARSVEVRQRPSTGSAIARVVVRGHSKTATTLDGRRIGRQCRSHVH